MTIQSVQYFVYENGNDRNVSIEEVQRLLESPNYHLILDRSQGPLRLRWAEAHPPPLQSWRWSNIPWTSYKVLYTGMSEPGKGFGHQTITELFAPESMTVGGLRRQVSSIRSLIQPGRVDGPYICRAHGLKDRDSWTGHGYMFVPHLNYLIIDFADDR